ncbi:MAG: cytochrome c [Acidimicrobiia bacterium]|nr:cytochrome c [Acidimicrobiia bacterium]
MLKRLTVIAIALALGIAGCGGSDDGGSDADAGGSAAAPIEVGPGDPANGEAIFSSTCVACHGERGVGIAGLGKPMPGSEFITGLSDGELIAFLKEGRGPSHPDNTTGVDMPAKGGNPSLDDQDLADVVAYMRTLG